MPDSFAAPGSRLCRGHASCTGVSALCPQDVAFHFCFSSLSRFLFLSFFFFFYFSFFFFYFLFYFILFLNFTILDAWGWCTGTTQRFLFLTTTAVLFKKVSESTAFCNLRVLSHFPIWVFSDLRAVYPAAWWAQDMGSYWSLNSTVSYCKHSNFGDRAIAPWTTFPSPILCLDVNTIVNWLICCQTF